MPEDSQGFITEWKGKAIDGMISIHLFYCNPYPDRAPLARCCRTSKGRIDSTCPPASSRRRPSIRQHYPCWSTIPPCCRQARRNFRVFRRRSELQCLRSMSLSNVTLSGQVLHRVSSFAASSDSTFTFLTQRYRNTFPECCYCRSCTSKYFHWNGYVGFLFAGVGSCWN